MQTRIFTSILSMAGLGLFFASVLAFVNQKLKVKEDPRVEAIENILPGLNCGACGFTSCHQYARALATEEASPDKCKVTDEESLARLAEILGIKIEKKTKKLAIVHCGADVSGRKKKAVYTGVKTCLAAQNMFGGENLCDYGCIGYGDCMNACPFGAIEMVGALPKIDKDKCVACGKCVVACPRNIISLEEIKPGNFLYVACNNPDECALTREVCDLGCIGCGLCQRITGGIFRLKGKLAEVEYGRVNEINNVKEVIEKCPTKCISKL